MKPKFKTTLLISGIALGCVAIGISAGAVANKEINQLRFADAETYTLMLDSSNAPSQLTDSYQNSLTTITKTANDSDIYLSFIMAKASSGNYVQLANRGYMYNFRYATGRITGITAITPVLASGSLALKTTNAEISNGGVFLGDEVSLTSSSRYALPNPARYFQLQAGDSGAIITSLKIEYTCDGIPSDIPEGATYNVEDFEKYTATGIGYDTNHNSPYTTTNLRSAFYSTYNGANNANPLNGSGWSRMGSDDYLTYKSNKGRNNTKGALFKINNGNNFNYLQSKATFNMPTAIGKGSTLSMWIRGAYTSVDASANSTYDLSIIIYALYNSNYNMSGVNSGDKAEYVVRAGSDWNEYTLILDETKNYYAFGIYIMRASGTAYLPVDDISIHTPAASQQTKPEGIYVGTATVHLKKTFDVGVVFSFGTKSNSLGVRVANTDAVPTNITFIESTGDFSITTTGSYSGYKFGTISGKYNKANNTITNVGLDGAISQLVQNNGSITLNRPNSNSYLDCENERITLINKVVRRYKSGDNWSQDPGNVDRIVADQTNYRSGSSGLSPRPYSSGNIAIRLAQNIVRSDVDNLGFWIYNPSATAVKVNLYAHKTTNLDSFANADTYNFLANKEFTQGWTFYTIGFRSDSAFPAGNTLYNITVIIQTTATRVTFDDIFVF